MTSSRRDSDPAPADRLLGLIEALAAIRSSEPTRIAGEVAAHLAAAFGADLADVFVFREEITSLEARGADATPMGRRLRALGLDRLPLVNGGRAAWTFRTGAPHLTGQADRDPGELRGLVTGLEVRSVATAAVGTGGERRGVLLVASTEPDAWRERDQRVLVAVAGWVGLLMDRADLVQGLASATERHALVGAGDELARLTDRQRAVATLIAEGLTNAEIGRRLALTEGTVANHMEQALRRLGLRNRAQLAVWVCRHGLYRSDRDGGQAGSGASAPGWTA